MPIKAALGLARALTPKSIGRLRRWNRPAAGSCYRIRSYLSTVCNEDLESLEN
jgi:hypothetical protein